VQYLNQNVVNPNNGKDLEGEGNRKKVDGAFGNTKAKKK